MTLSSNDRMRLLKLKKGFEGERRFDFYTNKLDCDCLILNDLLLKINHTLFQIDSLIISDKLVYFYEIKNFEGDYLVDSDKFYKMPQTEIINPLFQLGRTESLLRQFLQSYGFSLPTEAHLVFVNPEFTLYQSPLNKPILFASQLNRYFSNFNKIPSQIGEKQKKLAETLLSQHIDDSPLSDLPPYQYHQLRKGITCLRCYSFDVTTVRKKCICDTCGYACDLNNVVIESVIELKLLFPKLKVTTSLVHEWCKGIESKYIIRQIMNSNFTKKGKQRWVYYK